MSISAISTRVYGSFYMDEKTSAFIFENSAFIIIRVGQKHKGCAKSLKMVNFRALNNGHSLFIHEYGHIFI